MGPGTAVNATQAAYAIASTGSFANYLWYTTPGSNWTVFPTAAPGPLAFVSVGPVGGELWVVTTTGAIFYWNASPTVMAWTPAGSEVLPFPQASQCAAVDQNGWFWYWPGSAAATKDGFLVAAGYSVADGVAPVGNPSVALNFKTGCSHLAISASGTAWLTYPTSTVASTAYYSSNLDSTSTETTWTSAGIVSPYALIATDAYGNAFTETNTGTVESYPWPTGPWTALPGYEPAFSALAVGAGDELWGSGENSVLSSSNSCVEEPASYTCGIFFCGQPEDNCGQTIVCSPCVVTPPPPRTAPSP